MDPISIILLSIVSVISVIFGGKKLQGKCKVSNKKGNIVMELETIGKHMRNLSKDIQDVKITIGSGKYIRESNGDKTEFKI